MLSTELSLHKTNAWARNVNCIKTSELLNFWHGFSLHIGSIRLINIKNNKQRSVSYIVNADSMWAQRKSFWQLYKNCLSKMTWLDYHLDLTILSRRISFRGGNLTTHTMSPFIYFFYRLCVATYDETSGANVLKYQYVNLHTMKAHHGEINK